VHARRAAVIDVPDRNEGRIRDTRNAYRGARLPWWPIAELSSLIAAPACRSSIDKHHAVVPRPGEYGNSAAICRASELVLLSIARLVAAQAVQFA
jgi:hypothetical protein